MKTIEDLYLDHADSDSFVRSKTREKVEAKAFVLIPKLPEDVWQAAEDEIMDFACAAEKDGYINGFRQAVKLMSACASGEIEVTA